MISLDNCTKVRGIYFTSLNSYPLSRIMIMITFMHKKDTLQMMAKDKQHIVI